MNPKSFLSSKTIWGIILASLATVLQRLHINLVPGDVDNIAADIAQVIGLLFAAYGRAVATQPLVAVKPPAAVLMLCSLPFLTHCSTVQGWLATPAGQNLEAIGKSAAVDAAKVGLAALGASNPVLGVFTTAISTLLPQAAVNAQTPAQTAAAIQGTIAASGASPAQQAQITAAVTQALTAPSTVPLGPAGVDNTPYLKAVAAAMK